MTVLDASVVAKWYLPEIGSDEASRLQLSVEPLFAPALIRIEVTAAILRKFRTKEISKNRVIEACDEWHLALATDTVTLISDDDLFGEARELAIELKHPFQDCIYLACARRLEVPLITADPTFQKRASARFSEIRLLSCVQAN